MGALLALVEELLKFALVKVFSLLLFAPQLCYHETLLCTDSPLWDERASFTTAVATNSLSLNQIFSLFNLFSVQGNGFSLLPLFPFLYYSVCQLFLYLKFLKSKFIEEIQLKV